MARRHGVDRFAPHRDVDDEFGGSDPSPDFRRGHADPDRLEVDWQALRIPFFGLAWLLATPSRPTPCRRFAAERAAQTTSSK
jgi:hypothetical protein